MVYIEILVVLLLIAANSFFALAELAIVSSRKSRLRQLIDERVAGAKVALELADAPSTFLASVQVGITLVGILAGAFGGATLAEYLAAYLGAVPWLNRFAYPISFALVVLVITYLTVVIGELMPKHIALSDPERWAVRVARPMRFMARIAAPLVRVLSLSSSLALRLVRRPSTADRPPISDEEIRTLIDEGIAAGVFEPAEKAIVERLFRLSDRRVNAIMTLRPEIVWIDHRATREEIAKVVTTHTFTAYPIGEDDIDNVLGIVFTKDIIPRLLSGAPVDLHALKQPPLLLPEWASALKSIERLRENRAHLAIIINEYGSTEGLLTLTDLATSLVGDIPAMEEQEIVRRDADSLLIDGLLPVDELKDELGIDEMPDEEQARYNTLGGFIMFILGRVAHIGDAFEWHGYRFEVVDMDGNRIDRVLITRLPT
jgi:putative hemolysin